MINRIVTLSAMVFGMFFGAIVYTQDEGLEFGVYRDRAYPNDYVIVAGPRTKFNNYVSKGGRLFTGNVLDTLPVDFMVSTKEHKIGGRAIHLVEDDDGVDVRTSRIPGFGSDGVRLRALPTWTTQSIIGVSNVVDGEFRAYGAAIELLKGHGDSTNMFCISIAPGVDPTVDSVTRYSGGMVNRHGEELECTILVDDRQNVFFGFNVDPRRKLKFIFAGDVYFGGKMFYFDPNVTDPLSVAYPDPEEAARERAVLRTALRARQLRRAAR